MVEAAARLKPVLAREFFINPLRGDSSPLKKQTYWVSGSAETSILKRAAKKAGAVKERHKTHNPWYSETDPVDRVDRQLIAGVVGSEGAFEKLGTELDIASALADKTIKPTTVGERIFVGKVQALVLFDRLKTKL